MMVSIAGIVTVITVIINNNPFFMNCTYFLRAHFTYFFSADKFYSDADLFTFSIWGPFTAFVMVWSPVYSSLLKALMLPVEV